MHDVHNTSSNVTVQGSTLDDYIQNGAGVGMTAAATCGTTAAPKLPLTLAAAMI